jgi:hypothetical protein
MSGAYDLCCDNPGHVTDHEITGARGAARQAIPASSTGSGGACCPVDAGKPQEHVRQDHARNGVA